VQVLDQQLVDVLHQDPHRLPELSEATPKIFFKLPKIATN
jgi:hypothetical protein